MVLPHRTEDLPAESCSYIFLRISPHQNEILYAMSSTMPFIKDCFEFRKSVVQISFPKLWTALKLVHLILADYEISSKQVVQFKIIYINRSKSVTIHLECMRITETATTTTKYLQLKSSYKKWKVEIIALCDRSRLGQVAAAAAKHKK